LGILPVGCDDLLGDKMITTVISIVAICVVVAEFWTGIAVAGWNDDSLVITLGGRE
jgi:hypothetical protein